MTLETQTSLVVDRSAQGDLLRINFNISFPSLSCEFATLDVSDALGTVGHEHALHRISTLADECPEQHGDFVFADRNA